MSPSIFCSKQLDAPFLCASKERTDEYITDLEGNIDFTVILSLTSALRDAEVTADHVSTTEFLNRAWTTEARDVWKECTENRHSRPLLCCIKY